MAIVTGKQVILAGAPAATTDVRRGGAVFPVNLGARLCDSGCDKRVAFILCHPAGDFTKHYLLPHLERHGGACLGLATRYINNDLELLMERCAQDLDRGVRFLREQGYEKVVLIGNSGGGSLSCFYQAEAERPSIAALANGDPIELGAFAGADAIILLSAHPGRAHALTEWLDPAIVDEQDPTLRDPALDLFIDRPIPYDRAWVQTFRDAQVARNRRLSQHALATLSALAADPSGPSDKIMVVHGTSVDPRFIDLTLDPNGRKPRSLETVKQMANAHLSMGRLSTMRTWLSQWSIDHSPADGPACLARTTVPVLSIQYEQDEIVPPSHTQLYANARSEGVTRELLPDATHFMLGQQDIQDRLARRVVDWANSIFQG